MVAKVASRFSKGSSMSQMKELLMVAVMGHRTQTLVQKIWAGPAQAPALVPQHQVVLEQAQGGSLAHGPLYQPFPPPVPRASPEQLLSEIRQALPGYELSRLFDIEATSEYFQSI